MFGRDWGDGERLVEMKGKGSCEPELEGDGGRDSQASV